MTTLPGPAALAGLTALIESVVDARLKAAGVTSAQQTIRSIRIARGKEIRELAEISGVSAPTISRLENGHVRQPDPQTLNKLARALGVSEQEYRSAFAAQAVRA